LLDPLLPSISAPIGRAQDEQYHEALAFLYGRINYERVSQSDYTASMFRLDRMTALLEHCGQPQWRMPALHVAGTKGKGSTAVMAAAMLQAAGYRVGLFTSPHVHRFEERLTVDGREPTHDEFVELLEEVRGAIDQLERRSPEWSPTFFEITTVLAWLYFARRRAEVVVLEVGLGGRLDATNVCRPLVSVITSISRDHTHLLGNTLDRIAREKAGIIKPGVPVISGVTDDPARGVIAGVARELGAPLLELERDISLSALSAEVASMRGDPPHWTINVTTPWRVHSGVRAPLPGKHQTRNTALALAAIDALAEHGFSVAPHQIAAGLAAVNWPLRIEILGRRPLVIADAAHNDASIAALLQTLRDTLARRRILVFGASRDKHVDDMLRLLRGQFDDVVLTQYSSNPRALSAADLAERAAAAGLSGFHIEPSVRSAWDRARSLAAPDDLVCATGSLFLAAEVREFVLAANIAHAQAAAP
jgi:dihydrofolate synthase/folylpolyglutamate synthase